MNPNSKNNPYIILFITFLFVLSFVPSLYPQTPNIPIEENKDIKQIRVTNRLLVLEEGPWVENITALDAGEFIIVVDTWSSPVEAVKARQLIEKEFNKKVKYVINTHHHIDHTFGNQAFSDCTIIGSQLCIDDMKTDFEDENKRNAYLENGIKDEKNQALKEFFQKILDEVKKDFRLTLPNHAVKETETLKLGNLTVKLYRVPGLHTRSNLTIAVPEMGIVFTRTEFHHSRLPVFQEGIDLACLLNSLDDILASMKEVKFIMVGHGQPFLDPQLNINRDYIKTLYETYNDYKKTGKPMEALATDPVFDGFPNVKNNMDQHRKNIQLLKD